LIGIATALSGTASADVISSNLQDTPITADFTGGCLDVNGGGWDINPFFGGVGVANSAGFQPARSGTGNLDPILNFSVGSIIDVGQFFSTGSGGSQSHLGNTFTSLQPGYPGFKLSGGNYGWMRVIFTGNTSGAKVKDWAYDNSGSPIVVGRVHQSTAVALAQTVTLSPGTGESFTLGSLISNTGGNVNSVVKTGNGTTTLNLANSHTGTTAVSQGSLFVNNTTGSGTGSGHVSVSSGATLGGTSSISGALIRHRHAQARSFHRESGFRRTDHECGFELPL
jgi:autotransporter-associated beta strand protein